MILIAVGLMCLLELKRNNRKKKKNSAEQFLNKNVFYFDFKTNKHVLFFFKHLF